MSPISSPVRLPQPKPQWAQPAGQPLWYKTQVFYEVYLRSFYDSNGDGWGDLPGLTSKLDYLQWLGVGCVWLLPFFASPMRDGGYDVADFYQIHPKYGTLADFQALTRAIHERGMRIIIDMLVNHTSDQHPWFAEARQPGSAKHDWYVWSDSPGRYPDARIIFTDSEASNWTWDETAQAYYWHRFFAHQPDLNYDNAAVQAEMIKVMKYWARLGVDGLRLDAVPYLFEREGTNCENLPETHRFLREWRRFIDEHYHDRILLAEANQWPEDAAAYFGGGDECQMAFHFPVMPRLFMSLRR